MRVSPGNYVYIRTDTSELLHLEVWEDHGSVTSRGFYRLNRSDFRWSTSESPGPIKELLKLWKCEYLGKL